MEMAHTLEDYDMPFDEFTVRIAKLFVERVMSMGAIFKKTRGIHAFDGKNIWTCE